MRMLTESATGTAESTRVGAARGKTCEHYKIKGGNEAPIPIVRW